MARTPRAMAAADAAAGGASALDLLVGSGILLVIGQAGESRETTSLAVPSLFIFIFSASTKPRRKYPARSRPQQAQATSPLSHPVNFPNPSLNTHAHTSVQEFERYPR